MTPILSYMGTKAALATDIAAAFELLPSGPLLDAFAGMSAIGRAAAARRNVWVNDTQHFSKVVSEFQFRSARCVPPRLFFIREFFEAYTTNVDILTTEFRKLLVKEEAALREGYWEALSISEEMQRDLYQGDLGVSSKEPQIYRLFSSTYSGTYFGLSQCIEIDSLRCAIDRISTAYGFDFPDARNWMLTALGAAISRCSNSTGHFAQYLTVSKGNMARVVNKRRRSVFKEWKKRLRLAVPVGDDTWRAGNRVYQKDACTLIKEFDEQSVKPAVIYADPPYTTDHYSRYYHILDTLVLYDYPTISGKGRYRQDRYTSEWSLITKVESCFEVLISASANAGAALVISYPENGLLEFSAEAIPDLLKKRYTNVARMTPLRHKHSTMGASKGIQKHLVSEQVFIGH